MTTFDELKQREESLLCRTYGRYPLAVASARGSVLTDFSGREYIDLLSGIAVTNLGHCHPALAEVMHAQAGRLVHLSNLFYQQEQLELAEKLLGTTHLGKAFFCNSGAEANEAAIKLARRYAQRVKERDAGTVITLTGAFHGRTLATVAATGQAKFQDGFAPIPQGFRQVEWGSLDALEATMDDDVVAVLAEIVQGEGGIRPMTPEYAQGVQDICRRHGVLFMVDEVQSGMCRTGRFWAFQHYGLTPDVVTSAKALANGLPMGAMLATDEAAKGFEPGSHATTFGAGALVSAVAARVVDIMQQEKLAERAERVGGAFMADVRSLAARLPGTIQEVRGLGLMIGIVLTFPGREVWEELLRRGFVLNLTQERVLRLLPALTVPETYLQDFLTALEEILSERTV
jgi:acetylornithine aminotransferase